jgi:hypothetical protein
MTADLRLLSTSGEEERANTQAAAWEHGDRLSGPAPPEGGAGQSPSPP